MALDPPRLECDRGWHHIRANRSPPTNMLVRFDETTGKMVKEQVKLRSYNGKSMGPLIERRPGDTLLISLSNFLPKIEEPHSDDAPHNGPQGLNTTVPDQR